MRLPREIPIYSLYTCNLERIGEWDVKDDIKFIIHRFDNNYDDLSVYSEAVTGVEIFRKHSKRGDSRGVNTISNLERIDNKYFTEEELRKGKISCLRVFEIYTDINIKEKTQVKTKIK